MRFKVMCDDADRRVVKAFPCAAMGSLSSVWNKLPGHPARRLGQAHAVLGCNHARVYKSARKGPRRTPCTPKPGHPTQSPRLSNVCLGEKQRHALHWAMCVFNEFDSERLISHLGYNLFFYKVYEFKQLKAG
jgi:hypothetical protein